MIRCEACGTEFETEKEMKYHIRRLFPYLNDNELDLSCLKDFLTDLRDLRTKTREIK